MNEGKREKCCLGKHYLGKMVVKARINKSLNVAFDSLQKFLFRSDFRAFDFDAVQSSPIHDHQLEIALELHLFIRNCQYVCI